VQWERLEILDLASNDLGLAAIRHLAGSPHVRHLRRLDLSGNNKLSDRDARELARSENLERLCDLSLGCWKLSKRGVEALAGAAWLPSLARLDLMSLDAGKAGLEVLRTAPLNALRWLELNYSKLGAVEVKVLLAAGWTAGLTHLDLGNNAIGDEGARALAEAEQLDNLVFLDVSKNDLSDEAGNLLRQRFGERVVVKRSWE
jgi:Leucine-rich repeat (LRR) protein